MMDEGPPGMVRHIGPSSWIRFASLLASAQRSYDLAHPLSPEAPQSPFAAPMSYAFSPSEGMPGTVHVANGEIISGGLLQQGTHLDALGHFGVLPEPWDGVQPLSLDRVRYFGDLPQSIVKPDAQAGLRRLSVAEIPPIVTTAVLLDVADTCGTAQLDAGFEITSDHLMDTLHGAGLGEGGILPGVVVLIHAGWGQHWGAHDRYYRCGPGLSREGAAFLSSFSPSVVGLDNPFTDPVGEMQLAGASGPPMGMRPEAPFGTHHHDLVDAGGLQIQNLKLDEITLDKIRIAAIMMIPLKIEGGLGSPIRPIAFAHAEEADS